MKDLSPIFIGTVKQGLVVVNNLEDFKRWLFHLEGKEIETIVRVRKRRRSNKQNAYYHAVVVLMIAYEMGISDEEAHDFLKAKFNKKTIVVKEKEYEVIRSTTDLSTIEMEDFLEQVRRWAAEDLNCIIPLPNEVDIV